MDKQSKARTQAQTDPLERALEGAAQFLQSLQPVAPLSGLPTIDIVLDSPTDGTLYLSGTEAGHYRQCLKTLTDVVTSNEQVSPKSVEKLFRKAILASLDINSRRSQTPFEQRLKEAIQELKASLKVKPFALEVYCPVGGLSTDGLPVQVGIVQFCIFDEAHVDRFRDIATRQELSDEQQQVRLDVINQMLNEDIVEKPTALIKVSAIEADAARSLALGELRLTLDVVNFFSDMIPYSKGHVFFPGDAERTTTTIPVLVKEGKPSFHLHGRVVGPLMELSLGKLLKNEAQHELGFTRISNILAKKRNKLEDRLLAAVEWAGRATVDNRKEEAFLLYAIALESLVLAENEKDEIIYRLATRIAHLLGLDVQGRIQISRQVRDLYDIRSKIVHSGKYQVTDANLSLIRFMAKNCIIHILRDEPFASMSSPEDLVAWFNHQILQ